MIQVAPIMAKGYPTGGLAEAFYNIFSLEVVRDNFQIAAADQDKLDAGDIDDGERATLQAIIDKAEFKKGKDVEPED